MEGNVSSKKNPETRRGDSAPCIKHVQFVLHAGGFCCYVLHVVVPSTVSFLAWDSMPPLRQAWQPVHEPLRDSQNTQRILAALYAGGRLWLTEKPKSKK